MTLELSDIADSVMLQGANDRCPHIVVRNLLGRRIVHKLLRHVARKQASFMPALVYREQIRGAIADANVRNCVRLVPIAPFQEMIEPRILKVLGVALAKLGLFEHEARVMEFEFCAYGDGGLYKPHHDVKPKGAPRIASCVYYFNRDPPGFTGGELRLYAWPRINPGDAQKHRSVDVVPVSDSLVIFPSALRHEVRPVTCPSGDWGDRRFTVNCWAYRRTSKSAA